MNPLSSKEAEAAIIKLVGSIGQFKNTSTVVCPPFIFLERVKLATGKKIAIGAQDCFPGEVGAETGQVSVGMLKAAGIKYIIVGHSEQRALGESDELISQKVSSVLNAGVKAVLCVGERVRDDSGEFFNYMKEQLVQGLAKVKKAQLKNLIVAYEPVWAIGKDAIRPAGPQDVLEVTIFIKKILSEIFGREAGIKVPIIYGGSVDSTNCSTFLTEGRADGLLVGRDSLNSENFIKIISLADAI